MPKAGGQKRGRRGRAVREERNELSDLEGPVLQTLHQLRCPSLDTLESFKGLFSHLPGIVLPQSQITKMSQRREVAGGLDN
ncbi:unnamed protein product, partial [Bubo scandiacus]